jgi:hypothetical protein
MNQIDIRHLQKADLTNQNVADLITVLEGLIAIGFVLPPAAAEALERLQKRK